jgi:hypothetical protein
MILLPDFITGVIAAAIASAFGYFANILVGFINNKESKNIKIETDEIVKNIQEQPDYDVFKLLYKNVRESTEYYIISKRQANKSFTLAIISCFLGVIIYICGFVIVAILDKDIAIFTTIAGTVVELIAGLSFWVYNKCIKQLNEYHKRLNSTEKYLTSIQMADKMSENGREEMYKWLIQNVMLLDLNYYKTKQNKDNNTQ